MMHRLLMRAVWEYPSIMTQYAAVIAGHSIALSLDISRPWIPFLLFLYLRKQSELYYVAVLRHQMLMSISQ